MPRKKIGTAQWGCSLPSKARDDLRELLTNLGCTYAGNPSLGAFLTRIWKGDLVVSKKVEIDADTWNL